MQRNMTLTILNPILATLMLSQLLSGLWRPYLSPEAFTWLHVRGGVALLVALTLHIGANWDWIRAAGWLPRNHIAARSCPPPRQSSSK